MVVHELERADVKPVTMGSAIVNLRDRMPCLQVCTAGTARRAQPSYRVIEYPRSQRSRNS